VRIAGRVIVDDEELPASQSEREDARHQRRNNERVIVRNVHT
jgi:hypothetical protein